MQTKRTLTGSEWVTLAEMKDYLKIEYTADDTVIEWMIRSTREQAENFTNKSYAEQEIEYFENNWISPIKLPFPNHKAVESVKVDGVEVTDFGQVGLTQFILSVSANTKQPIDGLTSSIYIKYTTEADISEGEKSALKKIVAEMYENRTTIAGKSLGLLYQYKVY